MMNILVSIIFLAVSLLPLAAVAQETAISGELIKKEDVLTLDKCIDIALQQQPTIVSAQYNIRASESRVGEAQSAYYPQLSATGQYSRIKPLPGTTISGNTNAIDQYSTVASLTQMIYDFGKTPTQVRIQKLNLNASRSDFDTTRAQTILNVKQAYYGVLQTKRNLDVAKETVAQFAQHLDQAKGFYEVGTHPKFDVTKAEVDLSNAKLNMINAENAFRIAKATLNNAMGLPNAPEYSVEDSLSYAKKEITFNQAVETAFKNRPEILATDLRVKVAEESIGFARKGYFPVISGNAAYTRQSTADPSLRYEGWNAGVVVTLPIFSGFLTHHQVNESIATFNAAKANEDALKLSITLEVQQSLLNLRAASERIPTAELGVQQATENLDIANGRYAAGVGNPIEVTDAQVSYTNSKTAYTQALYDYNVAAANLDKAMGVR